MGISKSRHVDPDQFSKLEESQEHFYLKGSSDYKVYKKCDHCQQTRFDDEQVRTLSTPDLTIEQVTELFPNFLSKPLTQDEYTFIFVACCSNIKCLSAELKHTNRTDYSYNLNKIMNPKN